MIVLATWFQDIDAGWAGWGVVIVAIALIVILDVFQTRPPR